MFDSLGNRMKSYERLEKQRFLPLLPVVARIDGRSFHTWTKGLDRPFDKDFMLIMKKVLKGLMEQTNATFGYTQSDELSLLFYSDDIKSQIFFDGKIYKMTSVLASLTTALFYKELSSTEYKYLDKFKKDIATFDCRVWQLPSKEEAANYFVWRELDAVRNSIQSVGQANFSHKELHKKSQKQIQEMLFQEKGINWNDFSLNEKRGVYLQRYTEFREFSKEELGDLPAKHEARSNHNLMIERRTIRELEVKTLCNLYSKEGVIFEGGEPTTKEDFDEFIKDFGKISRDIMFRVKNV